MEEYLQNMKALRFQMNDVEEAAAKTSVEEQTLITSIRAIEIDLESVKSKIRSLKEETEQILKVKDQMCSQILDKHKRIASLEAESSNLSQTLELLQQEKVSISSKLEEKRAYYMKAAEDLHVKFQEQQDYVNVNSIRIGMGEDILVEGKTDDKRNQIKGCLTGKIHPISESLEHEAKMSFDVLTTKLDSARAKLASTKERNSELVSDSSKMENTIKQLQCRINDFPPELREMDMHALEEEQKALLSDKASEMEYLKTLKTQVEQLKGISHVIKCACGEEYKVDMGLAAKTMMIPAM